MSLVLGLDFGTGGVRVGIFDLESRSVIAGAEESYTSTYPQPGWAEQSPEDWWEALGKASRRAMSLAGFPQIQGITASTTASTVVACQLDGSVLRPALLWMDARASAQATRTSRSTHEIMAHSGGGDAAEWLVPKAMWLAEKEPRVYHNAQVICECLDWINFKLTGTWVASRMNATCKWNYDGINEKFVYALYDDLGIPDLHQKLPQKVVAVGDPVDFISPVAASHLGLRSRPLLSQGGVDAHIGVLGADTVDPGNLLMIGGTSVVHLFHLPSERPMPGFWGPYPNALIPGLWLVEGGQVSAGSVLSWFSKQIFQLDEAGTRALIEEACDRPIDGAGLLTLDYFMGNRTPYRDPCLRGAILGLSLGHDRAALYRSAAEGVALASANVVSQAQAQGVPIERIVSSGGYRKNALWLQATVDAIGLSIELASEENLTIVGCAAAAATGLGIFPDLRAAAKAVTRPGLVIDPDPCAHAIYTEALERYRATSAVLTDTLHELCDDRSAARVSALPAAAPEGPHARTH